MSLTTPDISVIICAYTEKRWHDLVAAVESVRQQTLQAFEIILVIDHNPVLLQRVRDHLPHVVVVENTEKRGLSGARNSGIAVATSPIVVFLDDDAVATSDWLLFLNRAFADPQVLGVGGPVIPLWLDNQPTWLPEEFHWVIGCTYKGAPHTALVIRNPIGANMAFRRDIFAIVGGFRCEIGRVGTRLLGCEETELCIRIRQRWPQTGFLYQPQASVFHRIPASRTSWQYFLSRCYSEGISKAYVSHSVGIKDGLASERAYTFRTLPQGIARGLIDALIRHDLGGFARAGTIIAGLAITTGWLLSRQYFFTPLEHQKTILPCQWFFTRAPIHHHPLPARTGS